MSESWSNELAETLAQEALWDEGVEAARNACVAGADLAAAAITASAWYANPMCGTAALRLCMERLADLPLEIEAWRKALTPLKHPETLDPAFVPGFGFVTPAASDELLALAGRLQPQADFPRLGFFLAHQRALALHAGPLNAAGLCALIFLDRGTTRDDAERLFLLSRLEPALRAAQQARASGIAHFPFFKDNYVYEGAWPTPHTGSNGAEYERLKKAVGLE